MFGGVGPLRAAGAAALLGGLAALTIWVWTGPARPAPGPVVTADVTRAPSPSPAPAQSVTAEPSPTEDPRLAELRLTDRFLEFAEHPRALEAPDADYGFLAFAPTKGNVIEFEWANKIELWNSLLPPIRDEALLLGSPAPRPMWNEDALLTTSLQMTWHTDTTLKRGHFVEMNVKYIDDVRRLHERVWGALIVSAPEEGPNPGRLSGRLVAHMPPIDIEESTEPDFQSSRRTLREAMWTWITAQEPVEGM